MRRRRLLGRRSCRGGALRLSACGSATSRARSSWPQLLIERGFEIVATDGTAKALAKAGVACRRVNKVREGRPHIVDMIKNDEIA